ncbi:MAG: hypothetical protein JRD94_19115 [Deltaproteobacteria bacterium]|nr:hypothetical protein [Deltaproteobacteria bacterium]
MRYLFGFLCSCALGLAPVVGCGETTGDGGSGGSAGNGGMGGDGGDGGANTATVIVHASGFEPPQGTTGPLEGVQVCETGTTNCVMTGDQETSVTLDKEGRGSYLHSVIIPAEGAIVTQGLALDARLEDMYGRVMSPYPPEGAGTAFVDLRNVAGATFELVGTTGKAFYRDEELNWSLDQDACSRGLLQSRYLGVRRGRPLSGADSHGRALPIHGVAQSPGSPLLEQGGQ